MEIKFNKTSKHRKFEVFYKKQCVAKFRTMMGAKAYAESHFGEEKLIAEDTNNLEELCITEKDLTINPNLL